MWQSAFDPYITLGAHGACEELAKAVTGCPRSGQRTSGRSPSNPGHGLLGLSVPQAGGQHTVRADRKEKQFNALCLRAMTFRRDASEWKVGRSQRPGHERATPVKLAKIGCEIHLGLVGSTLQARNARSTQSLHRRCQAACGGNLGRQECQRTEQELSRAASVGRVH
jgi:hypothetical protein